MGGLANALIGRKTETIAARNLKKDRMKRLIGNMVDYLKFEIMRRETTVPVAARFSIRFLICKRKNQREAAPGFMQ